MAKPVIPENAEQEIAAIQTDVKAELPTSNPWLPWSDIRAEIVAIGKRIYAFYYHLRAMFDMFFPNTALGEWRTMWASFRNISPTVASKSTGSVTATGVDGSTISAGVIVKVGENTYENLNIVNVTDRTISILSLTRSGTTAICITDGDHELASGMPVTISGATETQWNSTFSPITVTDTDRFTFIIAGDATTPATGTLAIDIATATLDVRSVLTGADTNQDSGVQMQFEDEITGVDDTVYVQFGGITGGADADDQNDPDSDYNRRINETYAEPLTLLNPEHLSRIVMETDKANTRVWVRRLWNNDTKAEEPGCMSVFFVRDGDTDIIPSASYVTAAKAAIVEKLIAHTSEDDVFVNEPSLEAVPIDVYISGVIPNTTSMKLALEKQIDSFFRNKNNEGEDFSDERLKGYLFQTWDSDAGVQINTFNMITPNGVRDIENGQIPTKGDVSVT